MKNRLRIEIKEITEQGAFEGLLSPYGNVDQGGDVVEPGAYTKTLKERGNKVPLLWQHKTDTPIGELVLEDRPDGLWCKGQLLLTLQSAQTAYALIKARIVKGLSIGFEAVKDSVEAGVRHLKEIKLYEGSIVTFPMNEMAMIANVKGRVSLKGDFNQEFAEAQMDSASYQMFWALQEALSEIVWSGMTREEKIAAADTIIGQFTEAYTAFLPQYLDMLTARFGEMETWAAKRMEIKAGAMISSANKKSLTAACEHMMSAHDIVAALCEDGAGDDATAKATGSPTTPETKAAPEPEPVLDHSAAVSLIGDIRALIPKR